MNGIEAHRLQECETIIERGLKTFVDVGGALLEIRDNKLYRQGYSTFEDYCRNRWGFSKTHSNRLIQSAEVVGNLAPIGVNNILPFNEAQTRPLASLEPEQQREAQQAILDLCRDRVLAEALTRARREPDPCQNCDPDMPNCDLCLGC